MADISKTMAHELDQLAAKAARLEMGLTKLRLLSGDNLRQLHQLAAKAARLELKPKR